MGIFDVNYNFDNLIRLSSAGVEVSSFVQIKNALIKRYKEIYGNDIDLSEASGDTQLIMMNALLLYNGFNAIYYLSQNLDPASASGKYLDILCGLNNVFRKNASNSTAWLYVKYIGTQDNYVSVLNNGLNVQKIECVDTSGRIWTWVEGSGVDNYKTVFRSPNPNDPETLKPKCLLFTCEESGEIEAYANSELKNLTREITLADLTRDNHGDIYMTIDNNVYPFEVWQAKDATVGQNEESDEALKRRRQYEQGNAGVTVANGMTGSLLNVEGIVEAKLYSNVLKKATLIQGEAIPSNDGAKINFHDLYLCLRYKKGVEIDSLKISKILHEKNTPGIVTTPYNQGITGTNYNLCLENDYGFLRKETVVLYNNNALKYNVYWKECKSISPSMQLTFMYNSNTYTKETQQEIIKKAIKEYLFNLTIYDDLNIPNLLSEINANDTPINNQNTFFFIDGKIEKEYSGNKIVPDTVTDNFFKNKDTYYDYSDEYDEGSRKGNIVFKFADVGGDTGIYKKATLDIYNKNTEVYFYKYTGIISGSLDYSKTFDWAKLTTISKPKAPSTNSIIINNSDLGTLASEYTFYSDMNLSTSIDFSQNQTFNKNTIIFAKKIS